MARQPEIEKRIKEQHGDPQVVIPREVNDGGTLEHAAHRLNVRQSWLSRWLADNGYERVTQWKKRGGDAQQQA